MRLSAFKSFARNFLSLVSVKGTHLSTHWIWNNGELLEPGVLESNFLTAATGHKGDLPRDGIFKTLTLSLFCKVLDHFTKRLIPGGAKYDVPSG